MKFIRWFLGRLILTVDFLTRPRPAKRDEQAQADIDDVTSKMSLYQFEACPFCVKVRRYSRKHNLNIDLRDAKNNTGYKDELTTQGGKHKVPCLRIETSDKHVTWLYESKEIMSYLETEFKLAS